MSYSQYERGKYIKSRIMLYILIDGGHGKINTEEWGRVYDLISEITTAGTTHSRELAQNGYYKRAVLAWVKAKAAHRQRIVTSKSM